MTKYVCMCEEEDISNIWFVFEDCIISHRADKNNKCYADKPETIDVW